MTTQAHTIWVHGHQVQVQNPEYFSIERLGFNTRIGKAKVIDATYWFHFAIPTPVQVGAEPLGIKSVTIRFRTSGPDCQTVRVVSVHVYDAEVRIGQFDNLDLKPHEWQNATLEFSLPKHLDFGLGVSVGVEFVGERSFGTLDQGYIEFSSAGGSFMDPRLVLVKQPEGVLFVEKPRYPNISLDLTD